MPQTYLRGGIYLADLGRGIGSEQQGYRPVVIVQNDTGNKYSPTVIVAPVSSKTGIKPRLPTHCFLPAGSGLSGPSVVLLEQLRTLDKKRLRHHVGQLDEQHLAQLDRSLAVSVGLMRCGNLPPLPCISQSRTCHTV